MNDGKTYSINTVQDTFTTHPTREGARLRKKYLLKMMENQGFTVTRKSVYRNGENGSWCSHVTGYIDRKYDI